MNPTAAAAVVSEDGKSAAAKAMPPADPKERVARALQAIEPSTRKAFLVIVIPLLAVAFQLGFLSHALLLVVGLGTGLIVAHIS